ncbi:MAG: RidA family protein [Chloroflexia bacterium]|nr:RidA family protein [Chloroflexia bacterium]
MFKQLVAHADAPGFGHMFNWGLRIGEFTELYFLTGQGDVDANLQVRHPGDPLEQTRRCFAHHAGMLAQAGYTWNDVVWAEATVTKAFDVAANFAGFAEIWAETFQDVAVKPAAGVFRVVDALALPEMLIEIQLLAAK